LAASEYNELSDAFRSTLAIEGGSYTNKPTASVQNRTKQYAYAPSMFHFGPRSARVSMSGFTGNGNEIISNTIEAKDAVSPEVMEYVTANSRCATWLVGAVNLTDGTFADYRDSGFPWYMEEFLMSNWHEGYIWENYTWPIARNTSFVPSNLSTYPFLCSPPMSFIGDVFAEGQPFVSGGGDWLSWNQMSTLLNLALWTELVQSADLRVKYGLQPEIPEPYWVCEFPVNNPLP